MRKLAVTLALATTALSTPALARDDAWYVGVEGGAMLVEDIDWDIGSAIDSVTVDHRAGYDVGGTVGYDFGVVPPRGRSRLSRRQRDGPSLDHHASLCQRCRRHGVRTGRYL